MKRDYPPGLHPETIRMAEYISAVVAAGSVHPVDNGFVSPIQCRKRHNNRRCKGKIKITQRADVIEWRCTTCTSSGIISKWRGSDCDMSAFAVAPTTVGKLSVYISEDEYRALRNVLLCTREQEAIIAGAVWTGDEVLLRGSYADFDMLVGNLAFEVNHSRSTKKQLMLNDVCDRIEMTLRRADQGLS